jgi:hypothetical protein
MQRKNECMSGKERLPSAEVEELVLCAQRYSMDVTSSVDSCVCFDDLDMEATTPRGGEGPSDQAIVARYFHLEVLTPRLALPLALGRYRLSAK